MKIASKHIVEK